MAIFASDSGATLLATLPAARDFIADAMAHRKFVSYVASAIPLIARTIGPDAIDDGFVLIESNKDAATFVAECRKLRFWGRMDAER